MTAAIENSPALGSESRFHELLSTFAEGDQVLELPSGNDSVAEVLTARGVDVTTVDGDETLAFDNRSFDGPYCQVEQCLRSHGYEFSQLGPNGPLPACRRTPAIATETSSASEDKPLKCEEALSRWP